MIRPAPINAAPHIPCTAILCMAAIVVSLGSMFSLSTDPFILDSRAFWGQPWRIITCTLPHGSVFHLFFNLYWTWTLGAAIEHFLGRRIWFALVALCAISSSTAQFAFTGSPIGLSGVGYGFVGFLWVLSRRDSPFRGMIDKRTVQIFVIWFFICIILTQMNQMQVANIAHGVGALMGVLAGFAMTLRGIRRSLVLVAASTCFTLCLACASFLRPYVNHAAIAQEKTAGAYELLRQNKGAQAIPLLESAYKHAPDDLFTAASLMMAYAQVKRFDEARELFTKCQPLATTTNQREALADAAVYAGSLALASRNAYSSLAYAERATQLDPTLPKAWALLGMCHEDMGAREDAIDAYSKALDLDPTRKEVLQALERLRTRPDPN